MAQLESGSRTGVRPGQRLDDVPTPSLVVDLDVVERNIETWQALVTRAGKRFRPHIKTHKIPEIALMAEAAGACGIAAAKPSEAEVFVDGGCRDVVLAYPTVGHDKWGRLARMAHSAKVTVNVDSEAAARGLSDAAVAEDVTLQTQIEIDSGSTAAASISTTTTRSGRSPGSSRRSPASSSRASRPTAASSRSGSPR